MNNKIQTRHKNKKQENQKTQNRTFQQTPKSSQTTSPNNKFPKTKKNNIKESESKLEQASINCCVFGKGYSETSRLFIHVGLVCG
jgi:hypothetical protein